MMLEFGRLPSAPSPLGRARACKQSRPLSRRVSTIAGALLLAGCGGHQAELLRECRTESGETFRYVYPGHGYMAERRVQDIRDTEGWSHRAGTIDSCRTLKRLP